MTQPSLLRFAICALACVLTVCTAAEPVRPPAPQPQAPLTDAAAANDTVTVSEGTSMAVAVSPDGVSLVIDLQGSLWVLSSEGGAARRITDAMHDARQPSWSPDGARIAFQSYRAGTYDIWAVAPDGSGLEQLTTDLYDDREPAWSRDGTRLAFASDRGGSYGIWVLDVRTRQLRQITRASTNDYMPTWSPDDAEIAFVGTRDGAAGIYAVTLANGAVRKLATETTRPDAPSWSPRGELVYHVTQGNTSVLMTGARTLTTNENAFPFRVTWSSPAEFYYTADGKVRKRSLDAATAQTIEFSVALPIARAAYDRRKRDVDSRAPRPALGIVAPQLAPDGAAVAFAALGDIWIARAGTTPLNITRDEHLDTEPAWSPDGARIVYSSDRDSPVLNLWLHDVRSGAQRPLTQLTNAAMGAAWSPDGARIAFLEVDGAWRRAAVAVVDVATGNVQRIHASSFGPGTPTWSPDGRYVAITALQPYSSRFREGTNQILLIPSRPNDGVARWVTPATLQSIDARVGAGPVWSPDGSKLALVQGGVLTVLPVTPAGEPNGPLHRVTRELAHAPSWSGDSRYLMYQSMNRLRVLDIEMGATVDFPLELNYTPAIPSDRIVLHAGRLLDGKTATARQNIDVLIDGNRISGVTPHNAANHTGRQLVDAAQFTVMPGLIEFHSHLQKDFGEAHGRAWLAFGITTVRSPGGTPYEAVEDREAIDAGVRIGPRIFATGYLLEWQRAYYKMSVAVLNDAHLEAELERARVLEHDLLKSYVRMPDLQQQRIVEFAHMIGVPAASHEIYPSAMFGIDGVEHTTGTSRRGYSPKVGTLQRSYADVPTIIGAAGMTLTPTLALSGVWLRRLIDVEPMLQGDPRFALLPGWLGGPFLRRNEAADSATPARPTDAGGLGALIMAARRAGARIVAGTDTPNPASLHGELLGYVAAGMTPFEALQTATVHAAQALRLDAGSIEPGRLADLVIVDGNPLEDITQTHRVRTVIANGRVYERSRLVSR